MSAPQRVAGLVGHLNFSRKGSCGPIQELRVLLMVGAPKGLALVQAAEERAVGDYIVQVWSFCRRGCHLAGFQVVAVVVDTEIQAVGSFVVVEN